MAQELENLLSELTPPLKEWATLASVIATSPPPHRWYNADRREYAALQPYLAQLAPHVQMLWYVLQGQQEEPSSPWLSDEEDVEAVQKAIAFHQHAFELQPDWQPGRENIAWLYRSLGDYARNEQSQWQQAIEHYNTALTFASNDAELFFGRANAYVELKNYPVAIANFDRAIELNPDFTNAYSNRGVTKNYLQDWAGAQADFDRAIALNPDLANAYSNRGVAKHDLGNHPAAIADFDRAIELNPEFNGAYANRGVAKRHLGDYPAAIADYDRAIELNPEDARAYYNRGIIKHDLGDYPAASADYDRAIELNPDFAIAYSNRGNAKNYIQDWAGAQADFERALQIEPRHANAMYNLACCFALQGQAARALEWLAQAIAGDEKSHAMAQTDSDFDGIRSDPRFAALVGA